ncbi:MAG TPA: endonuclease/exonuclease/phosphatase family protein, partial [Candidatus Krumholzibacteria bacterium]|nr:endonuclease/exonuclease/phosphatase family protein [Candidatus Krumholzibacteria bacterium]
GLSAYYLKISDHRPVVLRVPMPAGDAPPPGNPFAALSVGTDSTLEVATWNLEMFPVAGATTTDLVAQAIEGLDVDIVALQEVVDAAAFADLLNALDGWEGVRATSAPYDQNLAFVYRPGAHLAITSAHEIYSANAREFPRSPFVLEATWDGAPFAVINNHLKCCGDSVIDETDPWDETTRRRDACRLLAEYIELNRAGTPVITVGDWNDELTDSEAGNVFADFLNAPAAWRFVDLAIAQDPDGLHSYPSYPSHIDHILVTPELFEACSAPEALTEVVPIENGVSGGLSAYYLKISDHRPVVLRFPMPATAVN